MTHPEQWCMRPFWGRESHWLVCLMTTAEQVFADRIFNYIYVIPNRDRLSPISKFTFDINLKIKIDVLTNIT